MASRATDPPSAAAPAPARAPARAPASPATTVRLALEALDRADDDAARALLHGDAEWHNTRAFPGAKVVHGVNAILKFWAGFREDFDQDSLEIEELHEEGDRVVCGIRSIGHGRASGAKLETRWAIAAQVRDEKIARIDVRGDVAKAMESAGMTPERPG
jgi:ketosteroid isomerase-like protein